MTDRRTQVLDAATDIAATDGFAALSVRAVAARAGIGASTLRHYFPTQGDLHAAVVARLFDAQIGDLRIADTTVPAATRLGECLAQLLPPRDGSPAQRAAVLESWLAGYTLAIGTGRTSHGASELAASALGAMAARARERLTSWLTTLEAEGALEPGDHRRRTTTLLALVDGLCLELLTPDTPTTVADAHDLLAEATTRLVMPPVTGPRTGP